MRTLWMVAAALAATSFSSMANAANLDLTLSGTYGGEIFRATSKSSNFPVPKPFTITVSMPLDSYSEYEYPDSDIPITEYDVSHLVVTNPLYNLVTPDPGGRGFSAGPTPGYSYAIGGTGPSYPGIPDGIYGSLNLADRFVDDSSHHQWQVGTEIEFNNGYLGPLDSNIVWLTPDILTSYFKGQIGHSVTLFTGWEVDDYHGGDAIPTGGISWLDITAKLTSVNGDTGVPEPTTWAMVLSGFAVTGMMLRRRPEADLSAS